MLGGPDQQEWLETQGAASGSRGQQAPGGQVTCLGRLRELVLNPRLSTERALMTSTQEDGGERKDSRGGTLRGRVAVEEAMTPGRAEAGAGAGAPQEGWGPQAGALLTGSRSRHSGFSWQRAKRTHRWATVRARGGAQGSTTSGRGLVLSLLGTRLAWDQRVRRAFSDPRAGPAPSRTFPKPTAGVRRMWGKGLK